MPQKALASILLSISIICIILITGCASTQSIVHYDKPIYVTLISSPDNATVTLDGTVKGFTPMLLEVLYLQAKQEIQPDETRERLLKIEKNGYEPYVLSFSLKDKEYEKIPTRILLKKREEPVTVPEADSEAEQKKQEPQEEKIRDEEVLKNIKQLRIENEKLREEVALLKEKDKTQVDKQKREMNADNEHADELTYTILIGNFIDIEQAQKQFISIIEEFYEREIDYLRIEKVEKYYSVRLGRFEDYKIAEKKLQEMSPLFSTAVILKESMIEESVIKLFRKSTSTTPSAIYNF
jgi:hypothetical protein